uniref:Replicative DNA helicase n=1 Tax=Candidatus Kentrum sp. UNK TaxID=2126344 RepID=A0A450ZYT5_9GAMM|nr:MAG: primary replicative DNA helicase [Candidatus Kentron sp. UNK]VFK68648.1 MAG: primary replicative DNA helicase [Candidatus Kentron sp. UNK]
MSNVAPLIRPPHSNEAEQSVLGGLMMDGDALDRIADKLDAEDFYRKEHGLIFAAIRELAADGQPIDAVTVSERLEKRQLAQRAGGLAYLGNLVKSTPSAANITAYAEIVSEHALLRALGRVGGRIGGMILNTEGKPVPVLLDEAQGMLFSLAERGARAGGGFLPVQDALPGVIERIDTLYKSDKTVTGVSTGFADLDGKTAGLQPGDLIIIAGRPSMGKTALAMNIAEHAATVENTCVGVFSMEMSFEQLTLRLLSSLGRIDQQSIRTGKLQDRQWPRLTHAVSRLNEAALFIDDTPAMTPMDLRTRARRLKREHALGLLIVDYLQLMQAGGKENRATELAEISRNLKALARELDIPVIALSQLNRLLETRPNKRPIMSDLRESGAIEQDADLILMIYRDEVYHEDSHDKGIAEIDIVKHRNGATGRILLTFLGQFTRFENHQHQ